MKSWTIYEMVAERPCYSRERIEWIARVVTRAVETHALRCGVPVVEQWAARWLSGADRSYGSCADAAYAAYAAYADELARQVQDMRDVIAERARKDGEG